MTGEAVLKYFVERSPNAQPGKTNGAKTRKPLPTTLSTIASRHRVSSGCEKRDHAGRKRVHNSIRACCVLRLACCHLACCHHAAKRWSFFTAPMCDGLPVHETINGKKLSSVQGQLGKQRSLHHVRQDDKRWCSSVTNQPQGNVACFDCAHCARRRFEGCYVILFSNGAEGG